MPIPRSEIVEADQPGLYHCVSRCVRRAFLCGGEQGEYEHRRQWLEQRLEVLVAHFAVDVVAYAVMSNHLHVLLWTDPQRAEGWSATEVARRWQSLFPGAVPEGVEPETAARALARDPLRIAKLRQRLASISWFNRCLKEPLARLANAEDGCTGAFWEGRFKCRRIVDEAGALACSVYVDLNPVRAMLATTPEQSDYTSVRQRIAARQRGRRSVRRRAARDRSRSRRRRAVHGEDGLWLTPLSREGARRSGRRNLLDIGVDAYLHLVDAVGRRLRTGTLGVIPAELRPILARLDGSLQGWLSGLGRSIDAWWGTTIGSAEALAAEAARRGRRWVVDPLRGE